MTTGTCGEGSRAVASDEARCTGSLIRQVKSGTFPVQEYWVRTVGLLWLCGLRNVRVAKVVRAAAPALCIADCRFSGDEKLPCNCGALNCRGFVNVAEAAGTASVVAPRATLEPVLP